LYSQFGSKERLAAEALGHALSTSSARMNDTGTLDDYVARYLSADHRDRRGDGCVMAALAGEIPRQGAAVRRSFTDAVRAMVKRIAGLMPGHRKSEDAALAIVATMVGALTLARAVEDPDLSDRILAAARRLALSPFPQRHYGSTTHDGIRQARHSRRRTDRWGWPRHQL